MNPNNVVSILELSSESSLLDPATLRFEKRDNETIEPPTVGNGIAPHRFTLCAGWGLSKIKYGPMTWIVWTPETERILDPTA